MALQNFISRSLPAISAAWLNAVDVLKFTIFGDAATKAQARTALTLDAPLEVTNGGTGVRTLLALIASLFPSIWQYINPLTAAEIANGATTLNVDFTKLPGGLQRYKADPTGVVACDAAFLLAHACNARVYDDAPEGGNYSFATGVTLSRYPFMFIGAGIDYGSTTGTNFRLLASAGAGAACIKYSAFASGVDFGFMTFSFENAQLGQYGFDAVQDFRQSCLHDIYGTTTDQTAANTTTVIRLRGGTGFTGGVVLARIGCGNVQYGIRESGACTTVQTENCELYGNTAAATQAGLYIEDQVTGASASRNTFDGWGGANGRGLLVKGPYFSEDNSHFENNTVNFEVIRGSGNARCWFQASNFRLISGGAPLYPFNGVDLCTVVGGPGIADFDLTTVNAQNGFQEYNRTVKQGVGLTPTYAAGDYNSSAGTWTVEAADVSTRYEGFTAGKRAFFDIELENTAITVATPVTLTITLQNSSLKAVAKADVWLVIGGVEEVGVWILNAASSILQIKRLNGAVFPIGAVSVYVSGNFSIA